MQLYTDSSCDSCCIFRTIIVWLKKTDHITSQSHGSGARLLDWRWTLRFSIGSKCFSRLNTCKPSHVFSWSNPFRPRCKRQVKISQALEAQQHPHHGAGSRRLTRGTSANCRCPSAAVFNIGASKSKRPPGRPVWTNISSWSGESTGPSRWLTFWRSIAARTRQSVSGQLCNVLSMTVSGEACISQVRKRVPLSASGAIHDVPGSDGVDIHSFHTARGEPHVSKIQKYRALGRKHLAEFSIEDKVAIALGSLGLCVDYRDRQLLPAGIIVESLQRGQLVHGRMLYSTSGSLLEIVHFDAPESFAPHGA